MRYTEMDRRSPVPQNIPQIAIDVKRLFGFMVPGFLVLIGLTNIIPALLRFAASGQIEMEIPRLITGGIFLIMGLVGVLKATQGGRGRGRFQDKVVCFSHTA